MENKLRLLGISTLAGLGLSISSASAADMKLSGWDIQSSLTGSAGISVRISDREQSLVATSNGGPANTAANVGMLSAANGSSSVTGVFGGFSDLCLNNVGTVCINMPLDTATGAYSGSINTDDGRLNFDSGDLTGGALKLTADITASKGNTTVFARINGFYDAVMDSNDSFERTNITEDSKDRAVADLQILDLYANFDGSVLGNPAQLRVGKQVINWGESTFVLGGNSNFNPIDVAALVKPGAEIKEALLPVEAIYGSVALPYDITLEAYVGGHDPYVLPPAGTPFTDVDGFFGGGVGGSFIGGGTGSGAGRINCAYKESNADALGYKARIEAAGGTYTQSSVQSRALGEAAEAYARTAYGYDCLTANSAGARFLDNKYALGSTAGVTSESERIAGRDGNFIPRNFKLDDTPEFGDTYGVAVRWYAENLGSTEFGFYAQKYNSRIPYVGVSSKGPQVGIGTVGVETSNMNRWSQGNGPFAGLGGMRATCGSSQAGVNTQLNNVAAYDPTGVMDLTTDMGSAVHDALDSPTYTSTAGSAARAFEMACISITKATATGTNAVGLDNGENYIGMGYGYNELFAEYPEIEVVGASFATTLLGWGVQGELAYRPDMPLQIDTDAVTISALVADCTFKMYGGGALSATFEGVAESKAYGNRDGKAACGAAGKFSGIQEADALNWDIGTTATFTRSNPIVNFLGADIAVLLTEFAGLYVEDMEDGGRFLKGEGIKSANVCTSGSDLTLGSVFDLDPRNETECRATSHAYGGVILANLRYNNFLGTALSVTPQVIYQQGIDGRAVRPAASWMESQGRAGYSVTFDYLDLSVNVSYSDYFGDVKYNRAVDKDFAAISIKTSF